MKSKDKPRMSLDTYLYLNALIDENRRTIENSYRSALTFIPFEPYDPKVTSGVTKAHKIFMEWDTKLKKMKEELHLAAASTYKDHPRKKMREFWGLKK